MSVVFLIIIYFTFISLGLPDSILGAAWPVMQPDMSVSYSYAGIISTVTLFGTIISSLMSAKLLNRFGTGVVTFFSVLMTAVSLLGYYFTKSFIWLVILSLPLGFGGGAVDSALNTFVSRKYKSYHMNFLHCFWGVGAMTGPFLFSMVLKNNGSWRSIYLIISLIQFVLCLILFISLPIWKKTENRSNTAIYKNNKLAEKERINPFKIRGFIAVIISLITYMGIEATAGLWGSSYLINIKGLSVSQAAKCVSMFYIALSLGRFISGFVSIKLSNRTLIRIGQIILVFAVILMFVPNKKAGVFGYVITGFGCAPIYPSMLHETPKRFGYDRAQDVMGFQIGIAYTGCAFLPPVFGFLAMKFKNLGFGLMPFVFAFYIFIMILGCEKINNIVYKK